MRALGLRVVGVHTGYTRERTEARVFCDRTHHRPGAKTDAEAEQGLVCQPLVGEQRGRRVLDVLDVRVGTLNAS
jgi:hypothetical protein